MNTLLIILWCCSVKDLLIGKSVVDSVYEKKDPLFFADHEIVKNNNNK